VTNKCLGYLKALTCSLQAEALDVVRAVGDIDVVIATFRDVRQNMDTFHEGWFQEITQLSASIGVELSIPRRCGRQRHRDNTPGPAEDPLAYYRRCLSVPLVDHLLAELDERFTSHHRIALQGLALVPSAMVDLQKSIVNDSVTKLAKQYEEDLPLPDSVASQIHTWWIKWNSMMAEHGKACLPTSPSEALSHATTMYPDIQVLLRVVCTLPVTSCSSERAFSTLKRIKTYLRSTCGNDRLTALALMNIHRDVHVSTLEVIDKFARRHPRRMQLTTFT